MKIKLENFGYTKFGYTENTIKHFEAEITDLMVFIGPDGTLNMWICEAIRSELHKQSHKYLDTVRIFDQPEAL